MDDHIFDYLLDECRDVSEATSYVEILNYSDPKWNTCEQHALTLDEFENFLHRRGAFAPPEGLPTGVRLLNGLRLIVQVNAKHPDTFAPKVISLPKESYSSMVNAMKLPQKGIETSAVVGPFFWSSLDHDDDDPHLHVVHRKSDVRKKGKTRGWELLLSHSFKTSVTCGFMKGTPTSDVHLALRHISSTPSETGHPLLLSLFFLSHDLNPANDQKQRDARDWLRRLENAVSMRDEVDASETYFKEDGFVEIDGLSRDLVECHGHVMWKRPQAYAALCGEIKKALGLFETEYRRNLGDAPGKRILKTHRQFLSRVDFYLAKLKGLENYIWTTLERLKVQREGREARLNLEIAGEQRRIAHASKRDSTAMKTLSLLGALFLPGTYLASVFGMSFFNFEADATPVSVDLWIYFAVTVPVTALIVVTWIWFDRKREAQHKKDDADLERNIDQMEKDIMRNLRKRTMSKAHTWNTVTSPPKAG
ncbi:uncharacterized protein J7T54_003240 [Emericellopsis cladophorae]|uniref:Uncharacterized protein n=1 Tax=Emericellopsis cladophorae TaxID=2686198 RepID=A0A9P9Y0R7_9HYPO|nr:uncharacterized protein J7T54_003240 [Emericellopsis cladophorae]KAI6781073.1 hypothetical protein J7T54_003240 [Emericellopsis cladophorae]